MNSHAAPQHTDVVIIGAGLGGLAAARELRRRGVTDFVILEKGNGVGGVWRENRYPNIACDTPIELYSYSFYQGTKWSHNFAPGHEILAYLEEIAQRYELEQHLALATEVTSARWDDHRRQWSVEAADGRAWTSRFVIWAGGLLSQPKIPALPGATEFQGRVVHTALWDDGLDVSGKNVAVAGGGATSIQVVPYAAAHAKHVYAFVRTPSHVLPKPERAFGDDDRARFAAGSSEQATIRAQLAEEMEFVATARFPMNEPFIASIEEKFRAFIEAEVHDPAVRAILTPAYRFGCRRPLVSNDYYPAFNQDNVTAIGAGLDALSAHSAIASDGRTFDVDIVILATGYDTAGMLGRIRVTGRGGRDLSAAWTPYPEAYLGTLVKGFPNLFLVNGPNLGAPAVTEIVEAQTKYIASCIAHVDANDAASIEIKEHVFDDFNRDLQTRFQASVLLLGGCTSWYRADGGTGAVFSHWPGTIASFREKTAAVAVDEFVVTPRQVIATEA